MAHYAVPHPEAEAPRPAELASSHVASPAPLGLGIAALTTAILGCFYTGFIIPFNDASMRIGVGAISIVTGIILVLAGMWEFRKGYMMTASFFTAYGGFLLTLGVVFLPPVSAVMGGGIHLFLGMLYLCWTIFLGVLTFGALRANASLALTLGVLFLAWLFLMLGSLINNNGVLLRVGGWLAIASALIAWLAALASILGSVTGHEAFHVPMGRRLAVLE